MLHCRVSWKLTDIDWPTCMSYIVFDYYDTVYNESVYNKVQCAEWKYRKY